MMHNHMGTCPASFLGKIKITEKTESCTKQIKECE